MTTNAFALCPLPEIMNQQDLPGMQSFENLYSPPTLLGFLNQS